MIKFFLNATTIAAFAVSGLTTAALAGGNEPIAVVPSPSMPPAPAAANLAFPSVFGAASAIPAPGGSGYVALTVASPRGGVRGNDADGNLSAGYTIGSPFDSVSLTFGTNINSLTDNFGDSGNLSLSVSRAVNIGSDSVTFIGASAGKLAGWGDASDDDETLSVYVSHLATMGANQTPVQFTAGFGNQTTLSDDGAGSIGEGVFFGVGVGVTESLSVSLSGTETQLNVGATVAVPSVNGLSVSAGVYDVTDNADRQQFSLTFGYGF